MMLRVRQAIERGVVVVCLLVGTAAATAAQSQWLDRTPPGNLLPRFGHAMAYDVARQRIVLHGGVLDSQTARDTWEWDGQTWVDRTASTVPGPERHNHAMVYDAARRRVVLYGGTDRTLYSSNVHWEWDGKVWVQRQAGFVHPPALGEPAMAYDAARKRVVLIGGTSTHGLLDVWEWDGQRWSEHASKSAPPARWRHRAAYDAARGRVVIFGGYNQWSLASTTWEWDGKAWHNPVPQNRPLGRTDHAMAYDAARKRVVLYGGWDKSRQTLGDTWEWDGVNWVQRKPTVSPPPLSDVDMVYDPIRKRLAMFGGGDNRIWEYDGTTWVDRTSGSPAPRIGHAVAYDPVRRRVMLHGGRASLPWNETWEWNGVAWSRHRVAVSPNAAHGHAMVCDTGRKEVLLFGGEGARVLAATWAWNGAAWAKRNPKTVPPRRKDHAMAYDASRLRVVLFGGTTTSISVRLSDTWEWDGVDWTQVKPAVAPPRRSEHTMAFDARRKRVVLFGGEDLDSSGRLRRYLGDTWEWDGKNWTRMNPTKSPLARAGHTLAYDASRQRVVLHGGRDARWICTDTWEWDGVDWKELTPGMAPPTLPEAAMAYDVNRQRLVLFGGGHANLVRLNNATWEFSGTVLTATGLPRVGATVHLGLIAVGDAGRSYQLGSSLGTGPVVIGGRSLGLSPDGLLLVSTSGAWPQVFKNYRGVIGANGQASAAIAIPNVPALIGTAVHSAFVTTQPAAPGGVRAVSNTASFTILK